MHKEKIDIVSNLEVLHYDEYPILFVGKNAAAQNVLGTFIYEADDKLYFFYCIVSDKVLQHFIHQKLSYLSILLTVNSLYLVEKNINEQILNIKRTSAEKINPDFLPLASSFCPDLDDKIKTKILGTLRHSYIIAEPSMAMAHEGKLEYLKNI
jgi:hypothetical protein